jgi:hypothetical protein
MVPIWATWALQFVRNANFSGLIPGLIYQNSRVGPCLLTCSLANPDASEAWEIISGGIFRIAYLYLLENLNLLKDGGRL